MASGQTKSDDLKFTIQVAKINKRMDDGLTEWAERLNTTKSALARQFISQGLLDLDQRYGPADSSPSLIFSPDN